MFKPKEYLPVMGNIPHAQPKRFNPWESSLGMFPRINPWECSLGLFPGINIDVDNSHWLHEFHISGSFQIDSLGIMLKSLIKLSKLWFTHIGLNLHYQVRSWFCRFDPINLNRPSYSRLASLKHLTFWHVSYHLDSRSPHSWKEEFWLAVGNVPWD